MQLKSKVNHYTIERTIGSGTYARVKLAISQNDGKKYAIKFFKFTSQSQNQREMKKEHDILVNTDHKNIAKIVDFGVNQQYLSKNGSKKSKTYLVYKYYENGNLFSILQYNGRLSEGLCRFYFKQILEGLAYAHLEKEIVHRDLKPENLLICKHYNIKIGDFGHAKAMINGPKMSSICGSNTYRAPEMEIASSKSPYNGPATDIFSVGVILYVIYTGTMPFGVATDKDASYFHIAENRFDKYWEWVASLRLPVVFSNELKDLLQSMLNKEPQQRPSIANILQHPWTKIQETINIQEISQKAEQTKAVIKCKIQQAKEKKRQEQGLRQAQLQQQQQLQAQLQQQQQIQAQLQQQQQIQAAYISVQQPETPNRRSDLKAELDEQSDQLGLLIKQVIDENPLLEQSLNHRKMTIFSDLQIYSPYDTALLAGKNDVFMVLCWLKKKLCDDDCQDTLLDKSYSIIYNLKDENNFVTQMQIELQKYDDDIVYVKFSFIDGDIGFYRQNAQEAKLILEKYFI